MLVPCLLQAAPQSPAFQVIPLVLMVAMAYFLLIRPVQKQRKEQAAMRSSLKPGDKVLTSGGIYGTLTRLGEERLQLRVADGVQVEVARSAVVTVVSDTPRE